MLQCLERAGLFTFCMYAAVNGPIPFYKRQYSSGEFVLYSQPASAALPLTAKPVSVHGGKGYRNEMCSAVTSSRPFGTTLRLATSSWNLAISYRDEPCSMWDKARTGHLPITSNTKIILYYNTVQHMHRGYAATQTVTSTSGDEHVWHHTAVNFGANLLFLFVRQAVQV